MVKIVDCIQRFKEVGDIVVSFDPVHAALPWAGFRFLLQLATSEVEQTGMLLIMLEKVGPLVLRGEIYERIYLDPRVNIKADAKSSLKRTVVDLYSVVLSSMSVAGRLFSKGIARQGLHATTHPNTVKSLLDKLDEKGRDLGAEAQACEASRIESLHQDVSAELMHLQDILERPLARVDAYLENMWASAMSSERGAMLQWISPIAYDSDHDFARKNRLKGTAEWLLAREEYQEWKESNSSTIFWLHGIPGAGKTKLCSKVVDDCLSMNLDMDTDEGLAYFYCDRNREDHQDPDTILGSLAVYKTWTEQRSKGFPTKSLSIEKCKELLPALVGAYTQTIIIVDGLDECDQGTRYELMDVLDAAMNLPAALVKILIASRNDTDLVRQYGAGKHLQVKAAHNQGDIEKFVLSEMARSRNPLFREKMSDQLKAQILKTFRNKSRGMFQWAKLQIDELTSLMVESEVREYLQKLPEGLTRSYDNLLDRILGRKGRGPIIAIRAFLWIMGSWYPLTSEKLVAGVQQNPDTEGADPEDADLDIETGNPVDSHTYRFRNTSNNT
ncbi:Ankyrin repeat-containing domain protein [Pleurostoma richardsiae]|uniref:Ankyrin repeat-containing domain protein n=1 Tax=Pleurostoma richardsiae TaxID=41990 RepID=A0AA38SD91_9PEZI|nr:Ankyrin repeat-containing domain protein [Pleurostoma richardsiae]